MKSQIASIAEIKSACPGASAEFVVNCAERELSLGEVAIAWRGVTALNASTNRREAAAAKPTAEDLEAAAAARRATADQEWSTNAGGCKDRFIDQKVYRNYRALELAGAIRFRGK